ncbi:phosphohydrolase [Paenibacillus selenitireducens]|uniref:Phosphohydrolase n=1 Tax=Paenibacillus selenitireducens TaxID=1324314 RepID=A0A1T2XG62_9BACL|nr:NUDIX hydrolase [Paenibacillus selenitireducens]OPA78613.1 phosphohydrolase [Paenibacillus selenitireducens]
MFYVNARAFIETHRDGKTEIILQTRNKPNERAWELPGGRLELFEPILAGLQREVFEETGLTVIEVEGSQTRIDTCGITSDFEVECLEPYCVYQTIRGPIDSVGMYFICRAEGNVQTTGDDTLNVGWRSVDEIYDLMLEDPKQFSPVDRAGLIYYLTHRFGRKFDSN